MPSWRLYDYAASANCYKVRLALAQLGAPYERIRIDIFAGETLTDEYARINPARETPVLEVDGERRLPESGAILAYVAEGTPLLPDDRWTRAQITRWMLFEQTGVMASIGRMRFHLITGRVRPDEPDAARMRGAAMAGLRVLERHLGSGMPFLVGDRYTIADIAVYGYAHVAGEAGIDVEPVCPAVAAWLERVAAQPGHMNDLEPYPANARPGAGRSIYG